MDLKFLSLDFHKLDKALQTAVLATVALMPVFFFDLYLFHKPFFNSQPLYLSITASYCMAFGWYLASLPGGFAWALCVLPLGDKTKLSVATLTKTASISPIFTIIFMSGILFYLKHFDRTIAHFADCAKSVLIANTIGSFIVAYARLLYLKRYWKKKLEEAKNQLALLNEEKKALEAKVSELETKVVD